MYIFFGFLTILILILTIVSHAPLFKISNNIKEKIMENGLIHFTSEENYIKIRDSGLVGKKADMGFPETLLDDLVWTYQYVSIDDMEIKHNIVISKARGKLNSDRYGICIKISGFCERDLNKLYKACICHLSNPFIKERKYSTFSYRYGRDQQSAS